jgi:hypothetical protein
VRGAPSPPRCYRWCASSLSRKRRGESMGIEPSSSSRCASPVTSVACADAAGDRAVSVSTRVERRLLSEQEIALSRTSFHGPYWARTSDPSHTVA